MASTRRLNVTTQMQDRQRAETRRLDMQRDNTLLKVRNDQLIVANATSDNRVETKRLLHHLKKEEDERAFYDNYEKEKLRRETLQQQREQEEALAKELEAAQLKTIREEKIRKQLRDNSEELRLLEKKLKVAALTKERDAILETKRATANTAVQNELVEIQNTNQAIEEAFYAEEEARRQGILGHYAYKEELAVQIREDEAKKQKTFEEYQEEQRMVDAICAKVREEERVKKEKADQLTLHYKAENLAFKEQQKVYAKMRLEEWEADNERVRKEIDDLRQREEDWKKSLKEKKSAKEAVVSKAGEGLFREYAERQEMDAVREDLQIEENMEQNRKWNQENIEKRIRLKHEAKQNMMEAQAATEERKAAEALEEQAFQRAMHEKFAREDRLDQMNAQKARLKHQEHVREVGKLVEERRQRKALEREQEQQGKRDFENHIKEQNRIIEEERAKIIKEHAATLLGYLPKGTIRNKGDLDLMDDAFKDHYLKRALRPEEIEKW